MRQRAESRFRDDLADDDHDDDGTRPFPDLASGVGSPSSEVIEGAVWEADTAAPAMGWPGAAGQRDGGEEPRAQAETAADAATAQTAAPTYALVVDERAGATGSTRMRLGEILVRARRLREHDVERVLRHQRLTRARFGEVVTAARLASAADVLWALAQQVEMSHAAPGDVDGLASDELVVANQPDGAAAEVIRTLRAHLVASLHRPGSTRGVALTLVSADTGEGKSYLAANLALALAQVGYPTVLVDADLRTPRQHALFDLPEGAAGLGEVLHGWTMLDDALVRMKAAPNLVVLPAGCGQLNPAELLQRPGMGLLLSSLRTPFAFVIVDTPAFTAGADAGLAAEAAGVALIVARKGHSRLAALKAMTQRLRQGGVAITGTMINAH